MPTEVAPFGARCERRDGARTCSNGPPWRRRYADLARCAGLRYSVGMVDTTELRTLVYCTFLGGCLLLAPRQWVSAGVLFVVSAVLFAWYRLRARRALGAAPSLAVVAPERAGDAPPPAA